MSDFIGVVARTRWPEGQVEHDMREYRRRIALPVLCRVPRLVSRSLSNELNPQLFRHEAIREMQCQLLRQELWTAETQHALRMKIEELSNGQAAYCGSAMTAVFRGLAQGNRVEGLARTTGLSTFHTGPDPTDSSITVAFQTITTAPVHSDTSREVCGSVIICGTLANQSGL